MYTLHKKTSIARRFGNCRFNSPHTNLNFLCCQSLNSLTMNIGCYGFKKNKMIRGIFCRLYVIPPIEQEDKGSQN